jgi:ParB-like chromosome segregation protein Spo0J
MARRGKIQEIADECGVDHKTVRRALERAELTAGRGGYDFAEAVAAVNAIADPARVHGHAATRVGGNGNGGAMLDARTRHEELKARRLEIENQKLEGDLVSRAAVTATGIHIITTTRTALLTLGHRVAVKVAGKSDVQEISRIVDAEVRDVLGALADETTFFAAMEADALS